MARFVARSWHFAWWFLNHMFSNRAGYKQSTSRTKDDQSYDPFSRRKFSTRVDKMLGVLADKMVERGEMKQSLPNDANHTMLHQGGDKNPREEYADLR